MHMMYDPCLCFHLEVVNYFSRRYLSTLRPNYL